MTIFEIRSYLENIEKNSALYEENNFDKRFEVIDFIGFQITDRIGGLLRNALIPDKLILLKDRAEQIKAELEEIDKKLFHRLRSIINKEGCTGSAFKNLVDEFVDSKTAPCETGEEMGYDNLDLFINGLSLFKTMPEQTRELEPEMVYYQKTPARIVFELVEKAAFTKEDVFFDLGAGLGQVTILVNLLTGIKARGIEFEPAFCDYARDCAAQLNLPQVTFINADAREADYSEGTVFFMFTPFRGDILQEVLEILRNESLRRKIKIITYGPCTARVALESWLNFANPGQHQTYTLGVFSS